MMVRQKHYGLGSKVRIKAVLSYNLPEGLEDGMEVRVVGMETGYRTVRIGSRRWKVPMVCIDSGYEPFP